MGWQLDRVKAIERERELGPELDSLGPMVLSLLASELHPFEREIYAKQLAARPIGPGMCRQRLLEILETVDLSGDSGVPF
jgi:hypothetical protein